MSQTCGFCFTVQAGLEGRRPSKTISFCAALRAARHKKVFFGGGFAALEIALS